MAATVTVTTRPKPAPVSAPQASMAGSVRRSAKPAMATSWRSIAATSSGRTRKRWRRPGDNSSRAMVNAAVAPVTRPVVARLCVAASTVSGRIGSARPTAAIPNAPASRSASSWADSRRGGPEDTGDSMESSLALVVRDGRPDAWMTVDYDLELGFVVGFPAEVGPGQEQGLRDRSRALDRDGG